MYTVLLGDYSDKLFQIFNFSKYFRLIILPFAQSVIHNWIFVQHCCRHSLSFPLVPSVSCLPVLVHGVAALRYSSSLKVKGEYWSVQKVAQAVRKYLLRCVAVPEQDVSFIISIAYMTPIVINCTFPQCVSKIFCVSLSYAFVAFVVSFVDGLVWCVFVLSLCKFRLWRQWSSIDWYSISNSVFFDSDRLQRYLDYFKWSCLTGHQLVVPLHCRTLCGNIVIGGRSR